MQLTCLFILQRANLLYLKIHTTWCIATVSSCDCEWERWSEMLKQASSPSPSDAAPPQPYVLSWLKLAKSSWLQPASPLWLARFMSTPSTSQVKTEIAKNKERGFCFFFYNDDVPKPLITQTNTFSSTLASSSGAVVVFLPQVFSSFASTHAQ